jgi:hypothetical protein
MAIKDITPPTPPILLPVVESSPVTTPVIMSRIGTTVPKDIEQKPLPSVPVKPLPSIPVKLTSPESSPTPVNVPVMTSNTDQSALSVVSTGLPTSEVNAIASQSPPTTQPTTEITPPTQVVTPRSTPTVAPRDVSGIYKYSSTKNTPQKPQPIFTGVIDLFLPLIKSAPYKTVPEYQIRYAGIISEGEFRVIDLAANNYTAIKLGNFFAQDESSEPIVDMCLVENMSFMERLFNKQQQSNNTWPIDGGIFNLSSLHKKKTISHLLVAQYRDGSAMLWSVGGSDTGGVANICSIHQKQEGGKSITQIVSWSRENIIAAYDDGSLSFIDVVTLQSAHLATPTPRKIVRLCPVQHTQQLLLAYDDCSIDVVDMTVGEHLSVPLTINLSENNKDLITCIEIFTTPKVEGFIAAFGFRSSRFVCVSLNDGKVLFEIHPPPPKNSPLFALFALDDNDCYPCMIPDSDSMPYFVGKQKYDSKSHRSTNQSRWRLKFNAQQKESKMPVFSPSIPVFQQTSPKTPSNDQSPSSELAVDIFVNDGITLTDGMFEIVLNDTNTGEVAMFVQLGPASLKVGHGAARFEFDIELDDLQQMGSCQRIIITHNRTIRKYRAYTFKDKNSNRHEILGILNYDEGDEEIEQLIQGDLSNMPDCNQVINNVGISLFIKDFIPYRLNPADRHAPPLTFDTPEEYLRDIVPKMNIWTRHHFTTITELLRVPPDVNVQWSREYISPAHYIVQCRENDIQTCSVKMKGGHLHADKLKIAKSAHQYVNAKPTYVGDDCVLVTLESSNIIRAYSLPRLECLTKHSLCQPHLLRSLKIPHPCLTVSSTGTVMVSTGTDTLLQAQIMEEDVEPEIIVEPTLFIPNQVLPQRPTAPIIGSVAKGLFTRFLTSVAIKLEDPIPEKPFDHDKIQCVGLSREVEALLMTHTTNNDQIMVSTSVMRDQAIDTSTERLLGARKAPPIHIQQVPSKRDELFGDLNAILPKGHTVGVTSKTSTISDNMNETKNVMSENLNKVNERGEKLQQLSDKTALLSQVARDFAANTERLKQKQNSWW